MSAPAPGLLLPGIDASQQPNDGYFLVCRTLARLGVKHMFGVIGIPVTQMASGAPPPSAAAWLYIRQSSGCHSMGTHSTKGRGNSTVMRIGLTHHIGWHRPPCSRPCPRSRSLRSRPGLRHSLHQLPQRAGSGVRGRCRRLPERHARRAADGQRAGGGARHCWAEQRWGQLLAAAHDQRQLRAGGWAGGQAGGVAGWVDGAAARLLPSPFMPPCGSCFPLINAAPRTLPPCRTRWARAPSRSATSCRRCSSTCWRPGRPRACKTSRG